MDATHLHLMLTHLPVLGIPLGVALLVWSGLARSREIMRVGLVVFVVSALAAIPVYFTGEPAEETIERLAAAPEGLMESHEDAAGVAFALTLALGAVALAGLGLMVRRVRYGAMAAGLAGALGLVAAGTLAWTAYLGGGIRHSEVRAGAASASNIPFSAGGYDDHDDDDD